MEYPLAKKYPQGRELAVMILPHLKTPSVVEAITASLMGEEITFNPTKEEEELFSLPILSNIEEQIEYHAFHMVKAYVNAVDMIKKGSGDHLHCSRDSDRHLNRLLECLDLQGVFNQWRLDRMFKFK